MTHIEYWQAFDGTKFDNETDCIEHELKQKLWYTTLKVICPETGVTYKGPFIMDQKANNECESVIVPDKRALKDLKEIQDFTGFYDGIDSIGKWKYDDTDNKWVIVERL